MMHLIALLLLLLPHALGGGTGGCLAPLGWQPFQHGELWSCNGVLRYAECINGMLHPPLPQCAPAARVLAAGGSKATADAPTPTASAAPDTPSPTATWTAPVATANFPLPSIILPTPVSGNAQGNQNDQGSGGNTNGNSNGVPWRSPSPTVVVPSAGAPTRSEVPGISAASSGTSTPSASVSRVGTVSPSSAASSDAASPSSAPSSSPSAAGSASPSAARTVDASSSPSSSSSAAAPSLSASASSSAAGPSPSATASGSGSASPSAAASVSGSPSSSGAASATPSVSSSGTPSVSCSGTSSASVSRSAAPSASSTASPAASPSGTGVPASASASASAAASVSPVLPSVSSSGSVSAAAPSASASGSSVATPSASVAASDTASASVAASDTASASVAAASSSGTASASASAAASSTPSASATAVSSSTDTASASAAAASSSATTSVSASAAVSSTPSLSASASAAASSSATATASASPAAASSSSTAAATPSGSASASPAAASASATASPPASPSSSSSSSLFIASGSPSAAAVAPAASSSDTPAPPSSPDTTAAQVHFTLPVNIGGLPSALASGAAAAALPIAGGPGGPCTWFCDGSGAGSAPPDWVASSTNPLLRLVLANATIARDLRKSIGDALGVPRCHVQLRGVKDGVSGRSIDVPHTSSVNSGGEVACEVVEGELPAAAPGGSRLLQATTELASASATTAGAGVELAWAVLVPAATSGGATAVPSAGAAAAAPTVDTAKDQLLRTAAMVARVTTTFGQPDAGKPATAALTAFASGLSAAVSTTVAAAASTSPVLASLLGSWSPASLAVQVGAAANFDLLMPVGKGPSPGATPAVSASSAAGGGASSATPGNSSNVGASAFIVGVTVASVTFVTAWVVARVVRKRRARLGGKVTATETWRAGSSPLASRRLRVDSIVRRLAFTNKAGARSKGGARAQETGGPEAVILVARTRPDGSMETTAPAPPMQQLQPAAVAIDIGASAETSATPMSRGSAPGTVVVKSPLNRHRSRHVAGAAGGSSSSYGPRGEPLMAWRSVEEPALPGSAGSATASAGAGDASGATKGGAGSAPPRALPGALALAPVSPTLLLPTGARIDPAVISANVIAAAKDGMDIDGPVLMRGGYPLVLKQRAEARAAGAGGGAAGAFSTSPPSLDSVMAAGWTQMHMASLEGLLPRRLQAGGGSGRDRRTSASASRSRRKASEGRSSSAHSHRSPPAATAASGLDHASSSLSSGRASFSPKSLGAMSAPEPVELALGPAAGSAASAEAHDAAASLSLLGTSISRSYAPSRLEAAALAGSSSGGEDEVPPGSSGALPGGAAGSESEGSGAPESDGEVGYACSDSGNSSDGASSPTATST